MIAITNMFIVSETTNGQYLAERYKSEFKQQLEYARMAVEDTPEEGPSPLIKKAVLESVLSGGLELRAFQRRVMDTFGQYATALFDDDLIEEIAAGTEPADLHDVIEIIREFGEREPTFDVLSIIPVDVKGTMGFVIRAKQIPKDMNP